MTSEAPFDEDDFDSLAAEYVLGLTPPEAQAEIRLRIARDPEFAAAVTGWQERFVRLTDDIKPEKPPKKLKATLKHRLFGRGVTGGGRQLWVWQGLSFAALALAAYISLSDLRVDTPEDPPVFAATIDNAVEGLRLLVIYDPLRGAVAVNRLEGSARAGRVLEFWAITPDAAPVSLGVLPPDAVARVDLPETLAERANELTFAISDEPPGGSSTGAPTGDILGAAAVNAL